ncbi:isochorismatase family protein [Halalkalibacterium halodurans]|uniref:isochorismatase family protein n=1 Tax=Halalkalibacterium halodurans TaxID=86665 RepID=UPI002AA9BA5E|nr:isochorismatase family protein [Halalkalibacterium halodurans]MDY7221519.1 isochorismatase family protein [Halalkalibacterium halodurans]MDY7240795.1 isochorismatase family protein [Halalkalibacterium halodurans]MED4125605.1 isochorismatase family protein [Halalkalibacterium halodurans]
MKQALIIIDAQQELIEGSKEAPPVFEKERLVANINTVIEKANTENAAIVFIRDVDVANGEGPGFDIHKDIKVPPSAVIFNKSATNCFYGTPLDTYLTENNIQHLVMMGCKTEHCIDTAVRTATVRHVDVTLVGDGHSTTDSKTLSAKQIILHHNEALHGHYNVDHFSIVRNTNEALFEPTHNQFR